MNSEFQNQKVFHIHTYKPMVYKKILLKLPLGLIKIQWRNSQLAFHRTQL